MVKKIIDVCKNHTGYTHQWRNNFAIRFKGLLQASVDSFEEYLKASSLGFKCFYVKHESLEDPKNFVHCMASVEKGNKTNCNTCWFGCRGETQAPILEKGKELIGL